MSEMVERVARAMLVAGQERERQRVAAWPNVSGFYATPWEELAEEVKAEWIANARSAIEAMREPTDGMTKRGNEFANMPPDANATIIRFTYQAMIDEALK